MKKNKVVKAIYNQNNIVEFDQHLVNSIKKRIDDEYRKHKDLDWSRIAAIKIVHMLEDLKKPNIQYILGNGNRIPSKPFDIKH